MRGTYEAHWQFKSKCLFANAHTYKALAGADYMCLFQPVIVDHEFGCFLTLNCSSLKLIMEINTDKKIYLKNDYWHILPLKLNPGQWDM